MRWNNSEIDQASKYLDESKSSWISSGFVNHDHAVLDLAEVTEIFVQILLYVEEHNILEKYYDIILATWKNEEQEKDVKAEEEAIEEGK